jgi:hypothetical protein
MAAVNTTYSLEEGQIFMDSSTQSIVVAQGKHTAFSPCCLYHLQKENILKHEGNSQVHYLQDISMAYMQWFERNCHLMGLQKGYTKFCSVLCIWDSCAKSVHYSKNNWPLHKSHTPGTENIAYLYLVDPHKMLLPSLCIEFGLLKNFMALDSNGPASCFV